MQLRKNFIPTAFFTGSTTSCRGHIRQHYDLYTARCTAEGITPRDHCKPVGKGKLKTAGEAGGQTTLEGVFAKATGPKEFSKLTLTHAVAQLVVCDDQVSFINSFHVGCSTHSLNLLGVCAC